MLKFIAYKENGRLVIGFGMTAGNIKRLKEGKPIIVKMEEMNLSPADLIIFYGETPEKLLEKFNQAGLDIEPDTKFNVDKEFFKE
jgi:uncharacterized protein YciU (UPF0263 family)